MLCTKPTLNVTYNLSINNLQKSFWTYSVPDGVLRIAEAELPLIIVQNSYTNIEELKQESCVIRLHVVYVLYVHM